MKYILCLIVTDSLVRIGVCKSLELAVYLFFVLTNEQEDGYLVFYIA